MSNKILQKLLIIYSQNFITTSKLQNYDELVIFGITQRA